MRRDDIPRSPQPVKPMAAHPLPQMAALPLDFSSRQDDLPLCRLAAAFRADPEAAASTLQRFRWLAAVTGHDVVLGKLFEPHLDAESILDELLGAPAALALRRDLAPEGVWAVWAAQGPGRLEASAGVAGAWRLSGRQSWCSGARRVRAALVTARDPLGEPRLFAVSMQQAGITRTEEGWSAVGMAGTDSVDVLFDAVPAQPVGVPGAYVARAGFWHGAAGIAACWHGAAVAIAMPLRERVMRAGASADSLLAMHLGAVDCALSASGQALRAAAAAIDAHCAGGPAYGQREALQLRGTVEAAAQLVIERCGRALGAAPLCRDAAHARRVADFGVFLRQSHADWDLATQGRLAAAGDDAWRL